MLVLIGFESGSMLSAANTGGLILPLLRALFRGVSLERLELVHTALRKSGHVVGYAVLSWLLFRAWWGTATLNLPVRAWELRFAVFAFLGSLFVAIADELHQMTIPSRGGSWWDVLLDAAAALIAQILIARFYGRRMRAKSPVALEH